MTTLPYPVSEETLLAFQQAAREIYGREPTAAEVSELILQGDRLLGIAFEQILPGRVVPLRPRRAQSRT